MKTELKNIQFSGHSAVHLCFRQMLLIKTCVMYQTDQLLLISLVRLNQSQDKCIAARRQLIQANQITKPERKNAKDHR